MVRLKQSTCILTFSLSLITKRGRPDVLFPILVISSLQISRIIVPSVTQTVNYVIFSDKLHYKLICLTITVEITSLLSN